ncbi:MAG: SDR family oxidoreductase [Alphaproteobacteria bacterium]|nr:SDR family oxidoreductase [Alphaproteobacteria bacterium]
MAGRLDGKVAIVTGAASRGEGIGNGKATALLFAREGARVMLINRSKERAETLREEIAGEGGEAAIFAGDMTNADDASAAIDAAEERYGRLDILCNNIGIGSPGKVEDVTEAQWDKIIETNLKSAMLCARASIPAMRRAGGGSIINISSVVGAGGLASDAGAVAYATSKAGMHGFTQSVAADYAAEGIRSNCIVVGTVHTPMVAARGPEYRERRRRSVPLETEGTGWDIGWGAVYLASDESRWITGLLLPIDGGLMAIRPWPR